REEAADLAPVQHLHDLRRGRALPRDGLLRDAPEPRDVRAVLGVLDVARARELVAALPVLARALAVPLAGDGRVAAARFPDLAGREHEVDAREDVLDALRVVLDAARVEEHRARRLHPHLGRLDDARRRDADLALDRFRCAALDRAPDVV